MIHLTEAAQNELERIIQNEGKGSKAIRLGVKGGGCSGYVYQMGFETESREGDEVINDGRVPLFVDHKSMTLLDGIQIDFTSDILNRGFKFNNPNASKSCGCGTSFLFNRQSGSKVGPWHLSSRASFVEAAFWTDRGLRSRSSSLNNLQ